MLVEAARRRIGCGLALLAVCGTGCTPPTPPAPTTLRVGMRGEPASLDPHLQDDAVTFSVLWHVYEALTAFDSEMALHGSLAESWQSPDDLTWLFRLRPGVSFHDGRRLTAEDVVFSLRRALSHPGSLVRNYLAGVTDIVAVDARTVEIRTDRPRPVLLNKLAFVAVVPSDAPDSIERPVGTGPYRWVEARDGRVRLARFEGHWRSPAPYAALELVSLPAAADQVDALERGDVDLAHRLPPSAASRAERLPGVLVLRRPSLTVAYLGLRVDHPPFDDPRVREAIDVGLDRVALVQRNLLGEGMPAAQMPAPHVFGFEASRQPAAPDPARARVLLAEAGHPDGVSVELALREGIDGSAFVDLLSGSGIAVAPKPLPWGELMTRLRDGVLAFYFGGYLCASGDASDLLDGLVHTPDPERGYGSGNVFGFSDPQLDALIEESDTRLNPNLRREALHAALRRLAEQRPVLPLYVPHNLSAVREGFEWTPRLDGLFLAFDTVGDPAG